MTDGPSRKSAKSGISPNCVTAISFSSPVFKEIQLGTRLHDSSSVRGWKEYGVPHPRRRCRSNRLTDDI
jgi:hypothetical protein